MNAKTIVKCNIQCLNGCLMGVGTFLIGLAAICALFQTSGVLKEIFKVQEQAGEIKVAVKELKNTTSRLEEKLKELHAETIVSRSPILKSFVSTPQQIESAIISETSSQRDFSTGDALFIPTQDIEPVAEKLYRAKTESERIRILKSALQRPTHTTLEFQELLDMNVAAPPDVNTRPPTDEDTNK